jgi:hypothetical protein
MRVSINQPAYLPWLGYFHRIAISDLHIVLDQVQFEKNSVINRNKIRTATGWSWLTVPIKTKGQFGALEINRLEIGNTTNWSEKHWKTICQYYGRAPFFQHYAPFLAKAYQQPWNHLLELTDHLNDYFLHEVLKITTPLQYGSDLHSKGKKDELILSICRDVGATTYISGPFGRDYLDEGKFQQAGIKIEYHDYIHPVYQQLHGDFIPYLSIIDLLFNCGDESLGILLSGNIRQIQQSNI